VKRGHAAVAIPLTLYALALIGALVVGASFMSRQLAASVLVASRGVGLEPAGEELLALAIATWDSVARGAQPVGSSQAVRVPGGEAIGSAWVTRLSPRLYWLVGVSSNPVRPALRRRTGVLLVVKSGTPALVSGRAWGELP
jgi:hypothetical protein